MQNTVLNFDATTVDPNYSPAGGFLPVSDERGHLVILNEDNGLKPSSSGKGQFLELSGICQDGPAAGQTFSMRFNIYHESQGAVTAAYAQLSAIGHCVGVLRIGNASDLFNKPFRVVSELQDASKPEGYTQLARKNGIRDVNGNPPNAGNAGQAQGGGAPQTAPQMNGPAQQQGSPQGGAQQNPQWQGGPAQGGQLPPQGQQQAPQGGQGNWQGQQNPNPGQQGGAAPNWAQG